MWISPLPAQRNYPFVMEKACVRSGIRLTWIESRELKFDKLIAR
jgi:hypothetical protein